MGSLYQPKLKNGVLGQFWRSKYYDGTGRRGSVRPQLARLALAPQRDNPTWWWQRCSHSRWCGKLEPRRGSIPSRGNNLTFRY
jgi:hypothetical protein